MSKKNYGWNIAIVGFLIMAIAYASMVSCQGLFIKPVTESLHINRSAFSITTACLALGLVIGSVFMGNLIKKYSIKPVMSVCCVIVVLGIIGFSVAKNIMQFYVLGLIIGIAFPGLTTVALSVLINNWFGAKKKGLAMSIVFAGSGVGGLVLTMLLNTLILQIGWRKTYFVNAMLVLVILLPGILFIIKDSPDKIGGIRIGEENAAVKQEKSGISAADAKKSASFWMLFVSILFVSLASSALLNHQIPYFTDIGLSTTQAANYAAIAVGSLTVGKLMLGSIYDKLGVRVGALIGNVSFVLAVIALFLANKVSGFIFAYILLFCIGCSVGTIAPPLLTNEIFGEKDFPTLISLINVSTGVGAIFGSTMCARIYDVSKSYLPAWIVFIVLGVVIIFLHEAILKTSKKGE